MEETITTEQSSTLEEAIIATDYVENKQMADTTKEKLGEFLEYDELVEWEKLHQDGKRKFYGFIREAYAQGNIDVVWDEFSATVKEMNANLADETAKEFYSKYQKGIELLLLAI
jgi:hypothetical protein